MTTQNKHQHEIDTTYSLLTSVYQHMTTEEVHHFNAAAVFLLSQNTEQEKLKEILKLAEKITVYAAAESIPQ